MITHLLTRIDLMMNSFSKGQKRIALYIEEHYDKAAFMTAAKLGETVGVSESTVVRFATELGYDGYPKLQKAMQEMIRNKLTSVQRIEVTSGRIGNGNVLDKICKAKRIYIFGVRSTAAIASFLAYYFQLIFDNVTVINTTSTTTMYEHIFRITGNDIIIGISFPRYSTMAVEAMDFARSRGAHAVAITDSMASPLVSSADSILIARSDMASIVDSLVAPLSLINALIVATVLKKKDEVSETFRALEQVWNREGVYTNHDESVKKHER